MQKYEILELPSSKNCEGKMFMKLLNAWSTLYDVSDNGLDFMIREILISQENTVKKLFLMWKYTI